MKMSSDVEPRINVDLVSWQQLFIGKEHVKLGEYEMVSEINKI